MTLQARRDTSRLDVKSLPWAVGGAALGTAYVLLTGILSVRIIGERAGAVFNLNNEVVEITRPASPWVPTLVSALLSAVVFYAIAVEVRKSNAGTRLAAVGGFHLEFDTLEAMTMVFEGKTFDATTLPLRSPNFSFSM